MEENAPTPGFHFCRNAGCAKNKTRISGFYSPAFGSPLLETYPNLPKYDYF
jgi:hypothetical protein